MKLLFSVAFIGLVQAQFRPHSRRKQRKILQQKLVQRQQGQAPPKQPSLRKRSIQQHEPKDKKGRKTKAEDEICEIALNEYSESNSSCECTNNGDDTLTISCKYVDCDACFDRGEDQVCARLFYGVELENADGMLSETFYKECTEYTKGQTIGETICYTEEPRDDDGVEFECNLDLNGDYCDSCSDQCNFECSNLERGGSFDLCTADDPTITTESPFYALFAPNLFEKCFRVIDRVPGGAVAGTLTDPHIYTFDGVEFDCQAAGEFILVQSPRVEIQARFEHVGATDLLPASVITGIVVAIEREPTVQLSFPPNTIEDSCDPLLFMDSRQIFLFEDTGDTGVVIDVIGHDRFVLSFTRVNVEITIILHQSDTFGCFFSTFFYLPPKFNRDILGLLGSPDQLEKDEWTDRFGNDLSVPVRDEDLHFKPAHDSCAAFWCIHEEKDSLFTYVGTESFRGYFDCGTTRRYDPTLLKQTVGLAPESLRAVCGDDIACMIDGSVGDLSDASVYLEDRARLESIIQEVGSSRPKGAPTTQDEPLQGIDSWNWSDADNDGREEHEEGIGSWNWSGGDNDGRQENGRKRTKGMSEKKWKNGIMQMNKWKQNMHWKRKENMMRSGRTWMEKKWKSRKMNIVWAGMHGNPHKKNDPPTWMKRHEGSSFLFAKRTGPREPNEPPREPPRPFGGRFGGYGR